MYYNYGNDDASPTSRIIGTLKKYGLIDMVFTAMEKGAYVTKVAWKRLVKVRIKEYDDKRQRITCMLYTSLKRINWDYSMNSWWWVSYYDPSLSKICVTIIRLLIAPGKHKHKICDKCNAFQINDFEHIFFKCAYNNDIRPLLWRNFVDTCPKPMRNDINAMDVTQKTNFIVNGMNGAYTKEWHQIYVQLAKFIYEVWTNYDT